MYLGFNSIQANTAKHFYLKKQKKVDKYIWDFPKRQKSSFDLVGYGVFGDEVPL